MTTSKEKGRACWPVRLDVLFAALLVSPVYLAASVGRLAGFVDRHLWMVGVVTVAQVLWTALESFQGSSLGERWLHRRPDRDPPGGPIVIHLGE
jgi:hypothetical protein